MPRRKAAAFAAAVAAAVTVVAVPVPALAGHHHGGPSAAQLAAGRQAVKDRAAEVQAAAAKVAATKAQLTRLAGAAEVAVEAYDHARVERQAAEQAVKAAKLVVATAQSRVAVAQRRVAKFGTAAYMSGGMSKVQSLLSAHGPQSIVYRVGALQAIAVSQRNATQALDAARVYQVGVERQAQATFKRAANAAAAADQARQAAQHAVDQQTATLNSLTQQRQQLENLLADAKAHASALQRAHLAALARAERRREARAAAAAAAAAAAQAAQQQQQQPPAPMPPITTDTTGTVSAKQGEEAVKYAESQIGKPYVWGAAGPDSYDCSGLTMWAYGKIGVHLLHYTGYQWQEGAHIPLSSLRPGDLVFFATDTNDPNTIHHVGMFIGNGQMVDAPHTGAYVRTESMYETGLIGAVRPFDR